MVTITIQNGVFSINLTEMSKLFTAKYATISTHQTHLQLDFATRICIFNENYSNCQTAYVILHLR